MRWPEWMPHRFVRTRWFEIHVDQGEDVEALSRARQALQEARGQE